MKKKDKKIHKKIHIAYYKMLPVDKGLILKVSSLSSPVQFISHVDGKYDVDVSAFVLR